MATVGTTIFLEDGPQNFIELNNREQYFRTFYVPPSGWRVLNIGILVSLHTNVAPNTGSGLWIGLTTSAQPGVGFKQATYNNFSAIRRMLGWGSGAIGYMGTYSAVAWTHKSSSADISGSFVGAGAGYGYALSGSNASAIAAGGNVTPIYIPTTQDVPRKMVMVGSFIKSGATYSVTRVWCTNYTGSDGSNHNHTFETLVSTINQGMGFNGSYVLDGVGMYSPGSQGFTTQATDDANFPLDTVNIYWTGSCPLRIYGIAVAIPTI